jgi:hypothetical protein
LEAGEEAAMSKFPAIQFYIGDWMKDPALRSVSVAARGLWIDLLCIMHESPRRGYLENAKGEPLSPLQISRMTGVHHNKVRSLLAELIEGGVASVTPPVTGQSLIQSLGGSLGVLLVSNRRMIRDETARQNGRDRQERFRNSHKTQDETQNSNADVTGNVTGDVTLLSHPAAFAVAFASSTASSVLSTQTTPNGVVSTEAVEARSVAATDPALVAGWLPIIRSRKKPPPGAQFVTVEGEYRYLVLRSQVDEWAETFPGVSVMQELREAKQWLLAVPTRRKTDAGIVKFIVSWLAREQDKSGGSGNGVHPGRSAEPVRSTFETVDERSNRIVAAALQRIDERDRQEAAANGSDAAHKPTGTH